MQRINFVEKKPVSERFDFKLFLAEFSYLRMLFISASVLTVLGGIFTVQSVWLMVRNQNINQLKLEAQALGAFKENPLDQIVGLEFSKRLERYVQNFPVSIRLDKITGDLEGKKISFYGASQTAQEGHFGEQSLKESNICQAVKMKDLKLESDYVSFRLECVL